MIVPFPCAVQYLPEVLSCIPKSVSTPVKVSVERAKRAPTEWNSARICWKEAQNHQRQFLLSEQLTLLILFKH